MIEFDLINLARRLLARARTQKLTLSAAESCTGGLLCACLTEVSGSSDVFLGGFITYSNKMKQTILDVPASVLQHHGSVSAETARAMAEGACERANSDLAVAITGIAGPGGGSASKRVGLVYVSATRRGRASVEAVCRFGKLGRASIRESAVRRALQMLEEVIEEE